MDQTLLRTTSESVGSPERDRQSELSRTLERLYQERFSAADLSEMRGVWRVLVRDFFQRRLRPDAVVVDVGAGPCLFINEVRAARRIALDANPEVVKFAAPGVEAHVTSDLSLREIPDGGAGHVFLSNFLEHLPDYRAVLDLLSTIRRKLEPGGTLLVLQPNFRLVHRQYFDFVDHQVILTDRSLAEALAVSGFLPTRAGRASAFAVVAPAEVLLEPDAEDHEQVATAHLPELELGLAGAAIPPGDRDDRPGVPADDGLQRQLDREVEVRSEEGPAAVEGRRR